jgi:hypothetical protein
VGDGGQDLLVAVPRRSARRSSHLARCGLAPNLSLFELTGDQRLTPLAPTAVFVTPRALPTRTCSGPDRALAAQQGLSAIKAAIDAQASQSSPPPPPPPPPGASSAMSPKEKADDRNGSADEDGAPMTAAETLSLSAEVARANSPQPTSGFRGGVSPLSLARMGDDLTSTAAEREAEAGLPVGAAQETEAEAEAGEDRDATEGVGSPPARRARPDQATAAAAAAAAKEAQEAKATQSLPQLTPLVATEQGVISPFTPLAAVPLFGSPLGSERSHRGPYNDSPQVPGPLPPLLLNPKLRLGACVPEQPSSMPLDGRLWNSVLRM